MIVYENDRRRILRDCFTKDFARVNERGVEKSAGYSNVTFQPVLRVEHCDVKFFDRKILQPLSEYFVDVARTPYRHSFVALLSRHSPAELEGRVNGNGAGIANTRQTRERCHGLRRESPQRAARACQYLVANSDRGISL